MPKTSNVFARVEPELKSEAEMVLNQIGLPMSSAITLFLRQVVLRRGVPFPITIPQKPKSLEDMNEDELDIKLESGWNDYQSGNVRPVEEFFDEMERDYSL
ncbi:MAG: type II toxin-antitoxin system RelB/DinJ family antitoxin [Oscillospiraceae bacterium]|nr:type II toxin-antitoxin system RelB/DinJ family antitoxin [Oscillospiraceae bacterium]MCL2280209.1 type II toxin-antitoxin system RelB/DinJ family antitoxin [Oscillospiraceae bacterium]